MFLSEITFSQKTSLRKELRRLAESLVHTKTLLESVYASAGVNKLLLTGVERVTLGANLDSDVFLCGTGLDNIAASTGNGSLLIVGMNTLLHEQHLISFQYIYDCIAAHHNISDSSAT